MNTVVASKAPPREPFFKAMPSKATAFAFAFLLGAVPAGAEWSGLSGIELLVDCTAPEDMTDGGVRRAACLRFVRAVAQNLRDAAPPWFYPDRRNLCLPDEIPDRDLRDTVVIYLEENWSDRNWPAEVSAAFALIERYRCQ